MRWFESGFRGRIPVSRMGLNRCFAARIRQGIDPLMTQSQGTTKYRVIE